MTQGGNLVLWDTATGMPVCQPLRHGNIMAAFSPDGRTLLTAGDDNRGQLWDTATGKPLGGPFFQAGPLQFGAFRPNGHAILLGGRDGLRGCIPLSLRCPQPRRK